MNEDFLPDNYKMMAQKQTSEEYLNNLYSHASFARDHIQWYIDYIRKILNEMSFACSVTLNKKQKREIRILQKKRDEQLEEMNLSETVIKEDVNKLLNAVAGSVNYKWESYNLGKIVGFQSDEIKCSDNPIPLPIQSLYYISSLTYGYLINHAINALILKYKVIFLTEKDPQKKRKALNSDFTKIAAMERFLNEQISDLKKGQDDIKRKIDIYDDKSSRENKRIMDKIDKRNRVERRKTLTQEECADKLFKQKIIYCKNREDYLRKVGIAITKVNIPKNETMVLRTIQRWDQYLATNGEKGTKPPKGYSREKSQIEFEDWAEDVERQKYLRWEKKQPLILRKNNTSVSQRDAHSPEVEEDREEEEDDFETRSQEDMVERLKRFGIK